MDFRTLEEYPGYEIYEDGTIIATAKLSCNGKQLTRRIITRTKAKNGYWTVRLMNKDGVMKQLYQHRLVYMAFHGYTTLEIDHWDGDRGNNVIGNLRALTHRENCRNEVSMERYRRANSLDKGKFDRGKMRAAMGEKNYKKLVRTYKRLVKKHGYCGIMMLMKVGHCGYPRAKKLVAEMEAKSAINQ